MVDDLLTCALCGFSFEKEDTLCAHGCPLGAACRLVRCPGCGYEFPEAPEKVSWLARITGRTREAAAGIPEGTRTLRDLARGERARVVCLGARSRNRQGSLAVFGLVPGAEVTLLQQRPACVVRVDETELALDPDIAGEILVG